MARDIPVVCIVDDDEAVRDSLQVLLMTHGVEVHAFDSARSFLADADSHDCDCVLIDMHMPDMTGLGLLVALRAQGTKAPAVMITGGGDQALAQQVERAGAIGLVKKPVGEGDLLSWIDRAIEKSRNT